MDSILDKIVATKWRDIERDQAVIPLDQMFRRAEAAAPPRDFLGALARQGPIHLIAEVKRASPSAGIIRKNFQPAEVAKIYQNHGAACISVLTDESYFQGHLDHLEEVRSAVQIPVLRKDFILDTYQLYQARAVGADAVLLIAECLEQNRLQSLFEKSLQLGMMPLIEIYEPDNLNRVLHLGARLIGVNNRNLRTLQVDLEHTIKLRDRVPREVVLVAESGISSRTDVELLERAGVDAMLVGESLMRQEDIARAIDVLLGRSPGPHGNLKS